MNDSKFNTIKEVEEFLLQNDKIKFTHQNKARAYAWIEDTLVKFSYIKLSKSNKGSFRTYVKLMTGYSRAQVTRLITQYLRTGSVQITEYQRHK